MSNYLNFNNTEQSFRAISGSLNKTSSDNPSDSFNIQGDYKLENINGEVVKIPKFYKCDFNVSY